MNEGIKAVALDLDGTLTNARKEITPAVKHAIERAADMGVAIILASGRPVVGMAHVADELDLGRIGGYVLSNNGSKIIDWKSKETVFEATVPREAVVASCDIARKTGMTALVYDDSGLFSEDPSAKYVEKERYNNSAKATKVDDLARTVTWDPNKVMVVGEPEGLAKALETLQGGLEGVADVFLSEPYFIEVTPPGIRKDAALGILAERLGISLNEVMACGDGLNDIPMLRCSGLAVAMGNAYPETKEHADWIAPSNEEDGVAVAIDRFVLEGGAMLAGIPMVLDGDILKTLCDMGHGDEVVIADANFPAYRCGERVFGSPAAGADEMLAAVLKVMPLDHLRGAAVHLMAVEEGDTCGKPPIWESFESLAAESGYAGEVAMLERDAFYERAAHAYAIIRTGESALYGNVIVRKGVVRGDRL